MGESKNTNRPSFIVLALSVIVASGVLAFDLVMPLGVAGGVPYVALVLLGFWYPKRRYIVVLASVGAFLTIVGYFFSPDGGTFWVVMTNRLLALGAIWVTAVLMIRVKTSERALEGDVERHFRCYIAVTETAQDAVITADNQGIVQQWNGAASLIFGYTPAEIIGHSIITIIPERYREAHTEGFQRIIEHPQIEPARRAIELSGLHKSGREIPIELSLSTWSERGERRVTSIIRDVTVRHEAEAKIKQALQNAEVANKAKSELLANMSHELRTPLNAIIGFAESIKQETFGPVGHEKYREYIQDISGSGAHLLELIGDILDVSALEAGAMELYETTVDLREVSDAACRLVRERAMLERVSLTVDIAPAVPDMKADERRLKQILLKLLTNAIKFTQEGGEVTLGIGLTDNGEHRIVVADNGVGMSPNDLDKAMSQFGQIDRGMKSKHEGTGLGLPLTKSLTELHGGAFFIESEKGEGTTVVLTFPKERVIAA